MMIAHIMGKSLRQLSRFDKQRTFFPTQIHLHNFSVSPVQHPVRYGRFGDGGNLQPSCQHFVCRAPPALSINKSSKAGNILQAFQSEKHGQLLIDFVLPGFPRRTRSTRKKAFAR
jgi:hypothetical protein